MFERLIAAGLGGVLESPVLEQLSGKAGLKIIRLLKNHFFLNSHEIGQAFQESYSCAMATICVGLALEEEDSSWKKLITNLKFFTHSSISKEFSFKIEHDYLQPYVKTVGFKGQAISILRQNLIKACNELARQSRLVLPTEEFPEFDLASLLTHSPSFEITSFLLVRSAILFDLDEHTSRFLACNQLLGDAVLFFFRERLRQDERVEKTLALLQREGLWIDVKDINQAQIEMEEKLSGQLIKLETQLSRYQTMQEQASLEQDQEMSSLLEGRLESFQNQISEQREQLHKLPKLLRQAKQSWEESIGNRFSRLERSLGSWTQWVLSERAEWLELFNGMADGLKETKEAALSTLALSGAVKSEIEFARQDIQKMDLDVHQDLGELKDDIGRIIHEVAQVSNTMGALVGMMQHMQLAPVIKARDEFSQHQGNNIQLIQRAVGELRQLPASTEKYNQTALVVGSALSSCGALEQAEEIFMSVTERTKRQSELALASYNLFQVRLRGRDYDGALHSLQRAVELDRNHYLLFDMDKYVPIKILAAGGMGCAFLCEDEWEDNRKVIVKTFWEAKFGSLNEVFHEAYLMRKIAGDYVPFPLDRGYAYPGRRENPFIVMEYLEEAIDGESYLRQFGTLKVPEALHIGAQIAKGLHLAHQAGISHLDVKPSNLLFTREGSEGVPRVRMIDFGLARVARSIRHEALSKTRGELSLMGQQIFGSLDYAAPEQLGESRFGEPGPKSDLFAFGATLYRLMSGETPRTLNRKSLSSDVPQALYDLLCDCMLQEPERRPDSALEIIRQLEGIHVEVRRSPAQRFRERLSREFTAGGIVSADQEPELLAEGRLCGLEVQEARKILREVMDREGVRFEREVERTDAFALPIKFVTETTTEMNIPHFTEGQILELETKEDWNFDEVDVEPEPASILELEPRQVFRSLFQKAIGLVQDSPKEALSLLLKAEKLAPDSVDPTFSKWIQEVQELLQKEEYTERPWMRPGKSPGEAIEISVVPDGRMVWIPAGAFRMGSSHEQVGRYKDEEPLSKVQISRGFWFWETPVTVEQFELLMGYAPKSFRDVGRGGPVEMVNWHEAAAFCNALSRKLEVPTCFDETVADREYFCELKGLYRGHNGRDYVRVPGFRLPTEAEWEYAARAGTTKPRYGMIENIAWCEENSEGGKHPVRQKEPNEWGLYDTLGNVWEWCWDWYGRYPGGTIVDPVGPSSGSFRVKRGGSWSYSSRLIRSAFRNRLVPTNRDDGLGFRPAKVIVW